MAIQQVRIPPVLRGIMPVVVIPLVSSAVVGFLMFLVIGKPVAALQEALTDWLSGLSGANAIILGVVLGLMMCFDLGGPLNKVACAFAVGGLAHPNEGSLKAMAAVMAAGMVPPLAMALATTVCGRLFTRAERAGPRGRTARRPGCLAPPSSPKARSPSPPQIPCGSSPPRWRAVRSRHVSMALGCSLRAPHGGIFVVPLIGQPLLYLLAIATGTAVTAASVILLKSLRKAPATQ